MNKEQYSDIEGTFILIMGLPGSGKGEMIRHLQKTHPEFIYPVSCTTRDPRPGEKEGDQYFFVESDEFERRIESGDFLEWAQIDGGQYYGTLASEIVPPLRAGEIVVREVEVQGAKSIQQRISKENLVIIFIDAGPWEDLEKRVKERAPISEEELQKRRKRAKQEINFKSEADYIVKNKDGKLTEAKEQLDETVEKIINTNS